MTGQSRKLLGVMGWIPLMALAACATTAQAPVAAPVVDDGPRAFLWSVEDPAHERPPLYLLGSVHLMRPDMTLPPALEAVIAKTRVLAVEVDAANADEASLQHFVASRGLRTGGSPVESLLPEELRPRFQEALAEAGMPPQAAEAMRPWVLSLVVSVNSLKAAGYSEELGVETQLLARMRGTHRIAELESAEEQVAAMAGAPDDAFQYDLERTLELSEEGLMRQMNSLVDAWSAGDAKRLESLLFDGHEDPRSAALYEAMYHQRNRNLAERVQKLWAEGEPTLVVVGAGHMVGATGLPRLLEASGLVVKQLASGAPAGATAAQAR